jgi:LCP family protein required for cell wall assembly
MSMARRAGLVLLIVIAGWGGWTAFKVWQAWESVPRVAFDTERARSILAADADPVAGEAPAATTTTTMAEPKGFEGRTFDSIPSQTIDRGVLNTFLVIGTDERTSAESLRADVILLVILPPDTDDVVMLSLPRDLYVDNPCLGIKTKINANLNGCGDEVSGPELMAIAIEDYTGIPIDHFVVFDFDGFVEVVDTVGGIQICVGDHAVRDTNPGLKDFEMPAGCSVADGATALGWVRSRKTQILVDGAWQRMPGVTDLTRNERQQNLLIGALERLKVIRDVNQLAAVVERLSGAFTIDEGLGLRDAIGIAWDLRSISSADIHRPSLDVSFSTNDAGESILILVGGFEANLRAGYSNADLIYGPG